jgi:hypothetical protein
MEEVTKPSVADKPKPKWKSNFKKRNEAKEAKVLKFAQMWKEILCEKLHSNDVESIHVFVARKGSPQKKRKIKRKGPRQREKTFCPKRGKSLQLSGRKTKENM